jgi:PAS domain S-box-containing protein
LKFAETLIGAGIYMSSSRTRDYKGGNSKKTKSELVQELKDLQDKIDFLTGELRSKDKLLEAQRGEQQAKKEVAFRENECRLSTILEQLPVGVSVFDRNGESIISNSIMLRYVPRQIPSLDQQEVKRWRAFDAEGHDLPPNLWPGARALRGDIVSPGIEFTYMDDAEQEHWTLVSSAPLRSPEEDIIGGISVVTDITDRKRAEDELREREDTLRRVIDTSPIPIVLHNANEKVIYLNKKFTEMFGYTIEDIPSMNEWWLLAYPDEKYREFVKKRWYTATDYAIKNMVRIPPREVEVTCKDGSKRHVLSEFSSIGNINLSALYDITERTKNEKALAEAKMQAELYLDLMGHDISNMHQIAMGQLELANEIMDEKGWLKAEDKELIEKPLETLNRSARLIENVRNLQRMRRGEFKEESIDLGDLLANIVKEHEFMLPSDSIRFAGDGPSHVKANRLLHDVFSNIIGNAIKHSNGNGININIKLENAKEDGKNYYKVSAEDTGLGIPDDMKDKVFNRLQRGDTKARGVGLGLYIVKSLVDSYNGRVWVEDRVQGDHRKGSRFVVLLPVLED